MTLADILGSMTLTLISAIMYYPPAPTSDNKSDFFCLLVFLLPGSSSSDVHSPYGLTTIQLLSSWVTCILLTGISVYFAGV